MILPIAGSEPNTKKMDRKVSTNVSHLGKRQASTTGTAARITQHMPQIMLEVLLMVAVSLTLGKGKSGTGSWRKEQRGCQPSLTSNTSSLSGGTWAFTWVGCGHLHLSQAPSYTMPHLLHMSFIQGHCLPLPSNHGPVHPTKEPGTLL